jgi:CDP-glycerol glycerophosphotransferase
MSSSLFNFITRSWGTRLARLLGIEDIQKRLASVENEIGRISKKNSGYSENISDPALAQNILVSLQRLTEGIVTLDKRLGSYRSARFFSHLSEIYPKTKTVIFAGGSIFGDNIKYAYLSFLDKAKKDGIACYFLPANALQYEQLKAAGLPCLPHVLSAYTPRDISICLDAKVLVFDNHFVPPNWQHYLPHSLLKGARTIQLWHGIPIKEIGMETIASLKPDDPNVAELMASCGPFDVFVAPSAASRTDWKRKFSFRIFSPIGYPRNDVLLRNLSAFDKINVDARALSHVESSFKAGKTVILYAPTFRDYKGSDWFKNAKISMLADYCSDKGYLFYVNLHPEEQDLVEQYMQRYPKISFIAPHTDVYPIVKYTSVLITDYSSLAFDFLLLERPILFYRPDHADYVARSRHFIKDHDQYVCGTVSSTIDGLIKALEDSAVLLTTGKDDPFKNKRQALWKKLFDYHDDLAAQRLNDVIFYLLESER